jgi:hypothetical protein
MNQKTKRIWMVAVFVAVAALATAGALVFAETAGNGSSASSAPSTAMTSFVSKVAKNLGIEESKLTAAIETAREQTIDEALAAGRITEAQAAAMKERLAAEKAMEELIADGVSGGKITQEQADLASGWLGGSMMGGRGSARDGRERGLPGSCDGPMRRGMGR